MAIGSLICALHLEFPSWQDKAIVLLCKEAVRTLEAVSPIMSLHLFQRTTHSYFSHSSTYICTRAPIAAKINQCHFGESGCPKYALTFGAGQKKTTSAMARWHWLDGRHCICRLVLGIAMLFCIFTSFFVKCNKLWACLSVASVKPSCHH